MNNNMLLYDSIPIERSWELSMLFHEVAEHTEPWEICPDCEVSADRAIQILFGKD
jgi:hypothetical protein